MDEKESHSNPNPVVKANCLSKLFFWWLNPLFKIGSQRPLEVDDLYDVLPEDTSAHMCQRLSKEWDKELAKKKHGGSPSLRRAIVRVFGWQYAVWGIVAFVEEATKVIQPLMLGALISYFSPGSEVSKRDAYLFAMGLSLCAINLAVSHHPYFYAVQRIGMWLRVSCCSLVYRKSLHLSNHAFGKTTTGQIVNLMSNDVVRFDQAPLFLHYLWIGPLQAFAVLALLWYKIGPASLAGFGVLLVLIPVQGTMGRLFSKLRRKTAVQTDERVRLMNEILAGIRVIKMYCWENLFADLVHQVRKAEAKCFRTSGFTRGIILVPFFCVMKVSLFLIILTHVNSGSLLTPSLIFVTANFLNALLSTMTRRVPFVIMAFSELLVTTALCFFSSMEVERVRISTYARSSISILYNLGSKLLIFGLVLTMVLSQGSSASIRADVIFPAMALLHVLRGSFFSRVSMAIQFSGEAHASLCRLEEFLLLDEIESSPIDSIGDVKPADCGVITNDITASWDESSSGVTLKNISLEVKPGKLLAVIGPVGAGKSSLLMALLGELPLSSGSLKVNGKVAYASQQPWVFSASVRQNITFGQPFNPVRYQRVLKAAALTRDLEILPDGDATLVGERGVSMSGGQKARISLARALYFDADVYLLDDPLSAVDTAVGRHLFEKCIRGVLKSKPRILVTHQLQYLMEADEIVILKEGEMIGKGTFEELAASGIDFSALLKRKKGNSEDDNEDDEENDESPEKLHSMSPPSVRVLDDSNVIIKPFQLGKRRLSKSSHALYEPLPPVTEQGSQSKSCHSLNTLRQRKNLLAATQSVENLACGTAESMVSIATLDPNIQAEFVAQPQEEEKREVGSITVSLYVKYFWMGGGILGTFFVIILNLLAQTTYIMSDWWLSYWATEEENYSVSLSEYNTLQAQGANTTHNLTRPDSYTYLYIYSGFTASVFLFGLCRALLMFHVLVRAAARLHDNMFASIIRSPMLFFDTNPSGRILNRFSKDMGLIDETLPVTMYDFIMLSLIILGIVLVAGVINPWVFIPTLPLILVFLYVRRYFLKTSRDIKRLEGTTRSPVYTHLSATLQGLHTVRALKAEEAFMAEYHKHQDQHTASWFLFLSVSRWFAIRLDWLCAMFITAVAFCSVFASEGLSGGLVGLTLSYAMALMGLFQWGVRQSAEVENQMTSVERVFEYSNLPPEAPLESMKENKPDPDWPKYGVITGAGASLSYTADGPTVLKNLNFSVRAKEKVGIVGRTGAGKSSLITMLFRLAEPDGEIRIDGLEVTKLGLHDLRSKISIIPQDPVLFTGPVRRNLDPFSHHSDEALWKSLEEVQLKPVIEELSGKLDADVSEGGINFSVGQRQLICLARAILRQNKILIIDEATANVDPRTDALIQQTIRLKFQQCTVMTIAHRLNTIMDSDRVLVLNEGKILEFDHPYTLLQNKDGTFTKMVEQTGESEEEHLRETALAAFNDSSNKDVTDLNGGVPHINGGVKSESEVQGDTQKEVECSETEESRLLSDSCDVVTKPQLPNGKRDVSSSVA